MDFVAVVDQAIALLRQRGRVTYRTLQLQFTLTDEQLAALKDELLYSQPQVSDDAGRGLVWTGDPATAPADTAAPAVLPAQVPLAYTPPYLAEKILTSRSALEGERKQVTVLFADIKDFTRLIEGLDPEAAQQLLDPALRLMMDAVHRFEGTVNQVLGDGIMALFGAPIAHEDHALRACYAALALQTAIRPYADEVRRTHGMLLQLRVGLNSGEVVVRAIGNDLHMDYSAVGQTTHLAARMEQLATPGTILLTAATWRLVEGLVRVQALGAVPVKGLRAPVEAFELVGVTALRRRLQAAAARGLTRFVGRDQELAALHQALARAGRGHGQVVAIVGEAGVGKSRLVYEGIHSHHTQGWRVLESASVSYGKATPYFPVIDLLKRYAQIEDADDPRTRRARVTGQVLTLDAALQDTVPALLALLDALPDDNPFLQLDPPQRRQRTLDALKRVILRESQEQPLLLVFEDLHWIDAETQALLSSLVDSLPTSHLLLLVNYRPEYQHGWGSKTYYTQLRLDALPPVSAEEFLQVLLGDDPRLKPLTDLLIARTEGNPFFLEESVRTLAEMGVLTGPPGGYRLAQPLQGMPMPATVQAVLAARIDRLPSEAKRLLQTAAVIGTEVPWPLLQALAELPAADLHRGLAHLQAAEFLYETRLFPEREYTFKHALTHEVAYGSLLLERRRALHARVVETLETLAGDRLAEQVERLAHHAFRGERWAQTCTYFRQAGAKAATQSAYREAVTCFEQALMALQHLPASQDTQRQGIDLRLELREVLHPLGAIEQMRTYLHEAETLAETVEDPQRLGRICRVVCLLSFQTGDYGRGLAAGQRALAIGEALEDVRLQFSAHHHLGMNYHMLGDYGQARACLTTAVALEGLVRAQPSRLPGVVAHRAWLSRSYAELGAFAEGCLHSDAGCRLAEADDLPYNRVSAAMGAGYLYHRQGDLPRAIAVLERGVELCRIWQIHLLLPGVTADLGVVYALAGRVGEALPLLKQAVEQATVMRFMPYVSSGLAALSEGYLLAGRPADALPLAHQASELARQHHEQGSQAWVLRLLGDIASHGDPSEVTPAEAYYCQARTLAEALGMRPLQAHCQRGLGTLYAATGQREQARIELSTAIELYRAMDMTFWLPQTEAALVQVEGW